MKALIDGFLGLTGAAGLALVCGIGVTERSDVRVLMVAMLFGAVVGFSALLAARLSLRQPVRYPNAIRPHDPDSGGLHRAPAPHRRHVAPVVPLPPLPPARPDHVPSPLPPVPVSHARPSADAGPTGEGAEAVRSLWSPGPVPTGSHMGNRPPVHVRPERLQPPVESWS